MGYFYAQDAGSDKDQICVIQALIKSIKLCDSFWDFYKFINIQEFSFDNKSGIKDKYAFLLRKSLQMFEGMYGGTYVNRRAEQSVV